MGYPSFWPGHPHFVNGLRLAASIRKGCSNVSDIRSISQESILKWDYKSRETDLRRADKKDNKERPTRENKPKGTSGQKKCGCLNQQAGRIDGPSESAGQTNQWAVRIIRLCDSIRSSTQQTVRTKLVPESDGQTNQKAVRINWLLEARWSRGRVPYRVTHTYSSRRNPM